MLMSIDQGRADTGGVANLMRGNLVWLSKIIENFNSDGFRLSCRLKSMFAQIFQHHHKLIAAKACHSVDFAHAGSQSFGNLLQKHVPYAMAEGVVEDLEII